MRRRLILLGIDLFWVALSPFAALFIRDNFDPRPEALSAVVQYAVLGVLVAAFVLPMAGVNRSLWRYVSLPDLLRLVVAVTVIVLLSMLANFAFSRLEDIARSLPIIQWFVLLASMVATRLAIRLWRERRTPASDVSQAGVAQNILIVGVNPVAELFLRAAAEFAPRGVKVLGVLASGLELPGSTLRLHKVLGRPEDLLNAIEQLEMHGETIHRVVVAERPLHLSANVRDALVTLERSSAVKVDWLSELLGFGSQEATPASGVTHPRQGCLVPPFRLQANPWIGYGSVKRAIDIVAASVLSVILAPVITVVAALIVLDVGFPAIFWQRRPGRYGRSFKLYKFRTLREVHGRDGIRIPDQDRSSRLGSWIRHARLDELPQLYNILVGEMSLVGPRPLLPCDQPDDVVARLSVRPGLTGLAQAYGESTMSPNDKNALDIWYIQNASPWLDIRIVFRTLTVLIRGENLDIKMLQTASEAVEKLWKRDAARPRLVSAVEETADKEVRAVG